MPPLKIHTQMTSVVLGGSFNPRIFEPLWFSRNELVPEQEANEAEVQLINREFCHVSFGWVDLVALEDRLQVETTSETVNDGQIRDLLVGVLRLLPHTPIKVGSIHHRAEVAIASEDEWHNVGHALAPKELWEGVLDKPGMFDFAMQGVRPDELEGAIKVRIQPSQVVRPGIFLNVNDEFLMPSADDGTDAAELLDGLWPDAESRALEIRSKLLERLVP
jgi:hypothetical protein